MALGHHGFAVLWEPETSTELRVIPLEDESSEITQLFFATAFGRFIMLCVARSANGRADVVLWDLARLEAMLRLDIGEALDGHGPVIVRMPVASSDDVRLCGWRATHPNTHAKGSNKLKLWQLAEDGDGFAFKESRTAILPEGHRVVDAAFRAGDARVMVWTSGHQLWDLDLSVGERGHNDAPRRQVREEEQEAAASKGSLGRVLGALPLQESTAAADLEHLPTRDTVAQQVGLTPELLGRILPPNAPSHTLPPPTAMWANLLSVFGKPPPMGAVAPLTTSAQEVAPRAADDGQVPSLERAPLALPPWARESPAKTKCLGPEFVSRDWMDEFVRSSVGAA